MNVCLLRTEPDPSKVNPELISTDYCGLPRAELSNQDPAERSNHNS